MAGKRRISGAAPLALAALVWATTLVAASGPPPQAVRAASGAAVRSGPLFEPSSSCIACHNNVITPKGEDISFGADWRGSMMANSSYDPYWLAAVRREVMDHPQAAAEIEDECSICHMPMTTVAARAGGKRGRIFSLMTARGGPADPLAAEGVSCTVCHQITAARFGERESFTGGYVIDVEPRTPLRPVFGPFAIDAGRSTMMHSASGFRPTESTHVQRSELCATCHTLFTRPLAPGAAAGLQMPEQTPYLEWRASVYRDTRSCQSCHMPEVGVETPISAVLPQPRSNVSRHEFRGGNFFMLRMLSRHRTELGVPATPRELDAAIARTIAHLQSATATVAIARAELSGGRLEIEVAVENQAGHKFPTAYPSRRAWLHLSVRDDAGRVVFESGAVRPDGSIAGNDNDADPRRVEPHYTRIASADDVQIYESMMVDPAGVVTTGLLTGARFVKDNRLLPHGFDKAGAAAEIAVQGHAAADADFVAGSDRITYAIDLGSAAGPYTVAVALRYQPIAYRWAQNLKAYAAPEPRRFVAWYEEMADVSSLAVAAASRTVR